MVFKVIVSKRAQQEIENAIAYYSEINKSLAQKFYNSVEANYKKLETNPYFQNRYKEFRAIPLRNFHFLFSIMLMKINI
ncbi:type II toxin-antitoxin system RelE/ParE family toxin [Paenimyroides baculatum]|uniref:ParE toxin of type II toxin-antitoxin system, parDE n=1 Tax=Paenimyroides baculatum TaxID=2608000 RepID=A0A5M6CWM8_9FLAO|nr:type II toxin-antitoxin system RelE/ParE family toxin [Paenimyroides baculatum]KAA5538402.1 hypothetical protein F0460_02025 [Paenimyroides baculatum]